MCWKIAQSYLSMVCIALRKSVGPWNRIFLRLSSKICSVTQQFTPFLWNPKYHYHILKNLPLAPILSQMNAVLLTPSFIKVHFNIILMPTSTFFHYYRVYDFHLFHPCYIHYPHYSPRFYRLMRFNAGYKLWSWLHNHNFKLYLRKFFVLVNKIILR